MFKCKYCNSYKYITKFYCECGNEEEIGFVCEKCKSKIYKSKVFCLDCGKLLKEYDTREKGKTTSTRRPYNESN